MGRLWISLLIIMIVLFGVSINRDSPPQEVTKIETNDPSLITEDRVYYATLGDQEGFHKMLIDGTQDTIEKVASVNDIRIENLTFGHTYKEVKEQLGEPTAIVPILDEGIVLTKGHFVILEYPGLECIMDTNLSTLEDRRTIVELTVTGENYYTPKKLTVGSKKEELKKAYYLADEDFIDKMDENLLGRIQGLRRENHTVPEYEEIAVIRAAESPVVLIYLLKEDKVTAMLIRHLSAD